jgi:hypothetical protein
MDFECFSKILLSFYTETKRKEEKIFLKYFQLIFIIIF